jgi:hypothetical protein
LKTNAYNPHGFILIRENEAMGLFFGVSRLNPPFVTFCNAFLVVCSTKKQYNAKVF